VNKFLTLSQEGRRLAEVVEINAELLQAFLHEVLGVDRDQAEVDACKVEHLISVETSLRLYNFVNFVRRNPADAETFLAKYRTFVKTTCKGQPRNCELCKSVCMLDDEPVPPVPE
jgi:Mn-dependent DtxR family transcriptional regulator